MPSTHFVIYPTRHGRAHAGTIGQYRMHPTDARRSPVGIRRVPTQNTQVPPNPSTHARSPEETTGTDVVRIGVTATWHGQWRPLRDGFNPRRRPGPSTNLKLPIQRGVVRAWESSPSRAGRMSILADACDEPVATLRTGIVLPFELRSTPKTPEGGPVVLRHDVRPREEIPQPLPDRHGRRERGRPLNCWTGPPGGPSEPFCDSALRYCMTDRDDG